MHKATRLEIAGLAVSALTLTACTGSSDQNQGTPPQAPNQFLLSMATIPQLDLVFMIDNSPSMAPKQEKLKLQFPRLIEALRNPGDASLPDLRVAIIDSDLGTGGAYASGACGPNEANQNSFFGDMGKFLMPGAAACGVADSSARWLEYKNGAGSNFTGDIGTTFACIATNLGTVGCGFEQQLQAYEFALRASMNESQASMLRPGAYLGLVFLSDEDDCSAAMNDGMYGDKAELIGESASLRCATRGHRCDGRKLTATPPGYPTSKAFEAPLTVCAARTDTCSTAMDGNGTATDTSKPTSCSPLRNVQTVAENLKTLKPHAGEQLLVSGIFGWPLASDTTTYKIAPIPNPNLLDTAHPLIFDLWPVCYDPDHPPTNPDPSTGFDSAAAGFGATPGLRMSAFLDEFGANGRKFSICEADFSGAMSQIGTAIAKKMHNQCVPTAFAEGKGCTAAVELVDGSRTTVAVCDAAQTVVPCYTLVSDSTICPDGTYLVRLNRGADGAAPIPAGTWLIFTCA